MRKRKLLLIIVFSMIIGSSSIAFANINTKLANHWAEKSMNHEFVSYYFPYLARNNFENFNPDGEITRESFTLSLASLLKKHGYSVSGIEPPGILTRERMGKITGEKLLQIEVDSAKNHSLPFGDVSSMDAGAVDGLKLLHREKIIQGESNSVFNPKRKTTQAEAIIVLQRVDNLLKSFNVVNYRTLGVTQNYNNQEELITRVSDDVVTLIVTREFPTPGYAIAVSNIAKEEDTIRVYFKVTPPEPGIILPQVITYKTITVEIDRKELGEPPYDFVVEGFRGN